MAMEPDKFKVTHPTQLTSITNHKIENHACLTRYCVTDLREEFQFADRTAVVNCGSLKEDIGKAETHFNNEDEETRFGMQRATVTYQTTMVTCLVKSFTTEVDYVSDSPSTQSFFRANLKYLGLEVTPGSHVDQVLRSLIVRYGDKQAQGIFKHKWMLWLMKPFVWFKLPLSAVGLID